MRTTLNIDDDLLRVIRSLARERGDSLGTVASDLIRRGLGSRREIEYDDDLPVFRVREGAPPITPEMVDEAMEEG
jgi:hypothetical protein